MQNGGPEKEVAAMGTVTGKQEPGMLWAMESGDQNGEDHGQEQSTAHGWAVSQAYGSIQPQVESLVEPVGTPAPITLPC